MADHTNEQILRVLAPDLASEPVLDPLARVEAWANELNLWGGETPSLTTSHLLWLYRLATGHDVSPVAFGHRIRQRGLKRRRTSHTTPGGARRYQIRFLTNRETAQRLLALLASNPPPDDWRPQFKTADMRPLRRSRRSPTYF